MATAIPSTPAPAQRDALAAWRAGCPCAATTLLVGNEPHVRAFLRRQLSEEIDDAVQETLLRGIVGRERFGHRSSFRAFLLGVARRVALERYRAQVRSASRLPAIEVAANEPLHDDALHRRRMLTALRVCFPHLPPKLRKALRLFYWESLTSREIAERLGISENTVRSRLRRGRERLREHLDADRLAARHTA